MMSEPIRQRLACLSYWLLFIIAPSFIVGSLLDRSTRGVFITLMTFIGLILVGEHGYRLWRRVWKLADRQSCSLTDSNRF